MPLHAHNFHLNENATDGDLQSSRDLVDGWRECVTEEGHVYYYNDMTGVSTWDRPKFSEVQQFMLSSSSLSPSRMSPRAPLPLTSRTVQSLAELSRSETNTPRVIDSKNDDAVLASLVIDTAVDSVIDEAGSKVTDDIARYDITVCINGYIYIYLA